MVNETGTTKGQNSALHTLTGLILVILTGVKFNMGTMDQEWLLAFGRFAMPLFFIISGYFLYSKDGHSERSLPRKAKHILLLIIFIKLLYLAIDIIYYFAGIVDLDYLINAFVTSEETTMHVWFVYALFLLYAWWWLMRHYHLNERRISFTLSAMVLILCILFGVILRAFGVDTFLGVSTLYINEIIYPFIGIPFFTIGYYLHMYRKEFDERFSTRTLVTITIIGMIVPIITSFYVPKSTLYVGSIFTAVSLFMLTFRVPADRLRCGFTEFLGRDLKPFLYAYFPMIVFFLHNVAMKNMEVDAMYHIVGTVTAMVTNIVLSYASLTLLRRIVGRKGPIKGV